LPRKKGSGAEASIEEVRRYHVHYLRAMNNPLRRRILKAVGEGGATSEELQARTGLDAPSLQWHLRFLEHGSCLTREVTDGRTVYKLTQEGQVVSFLE